MSQDAGGRGRDYRESDVRRLLEHGPGWTTWREPVDWLATYGSRDEAMRSADVRGLLRRDFAQLASDAVPFTREPGQAYNLAREHRHHASLEGARASRRPTAR